MNDKFVRWTSALTLALALFLTVWTVLGGQPEDPVARSYNTDVYTEQGGGKLVVASGGELEVQSGGTLDIQSGATTDFSGGVDLDGASLVVDADGDSAMAEASDDLVTFTLGAATGAFEIRTGNLQVGNGTPDETHNGEDFYVEGIVEVDGAASFDGAVDVDNTLLVDGAADAVQLTVQGFTTQTTNLLLLEQAGGTDALTVSNTGNVAAAGTLDVQGGDITLQNDETIGNSVNGTITLGGAVDVTGASLQYGPNDLYPLGAGSSGFEGVWSSDTITGTLAVTHGLTTPVAAYCILGADPATGAGDAVACSAAISGGTVTIKTWQDDWTAATVGIVIYWLVIGTP